MTPERTERPGAHKRRNEANEDETERLGWLAAAETRRSGRTAQLVGLTNEATGASRSGVASACAVASFVVSAGFQPACDLDSFVTDARTRIAGARDASALLEYTLRFSVSPLPAPLLRHLRSGKQSKNLLDQNWNRTPILICRWRLELRQVEAARLPEVRIHDPERRLGIRIVVERESAG